MPCPDEEELAALFEGRADISARRRLDEHVDSCNDCTQLLADFAQCFMSSAMVTSAGGWLLSSRRQLAKASPMPERLGRYRVIERIGAGGMGMVYLAHDPQLDRRIAVKLVAHSISGARPDEAHQRLQREARALAKLSHPNVVPVFDVGVHDGSVFVAMEHVAGVPLSRWLRGPHTLEQRLGVLLQAGRGLTAAHSQGLVHRDVKPSNIMVGHDGRVRVLDFGLAAHEDAIGERPAVGAHNPPDDSTRSGVVLGTPAYMAPEQLRGERADARSDQFAFAVTAFEVLHGHRPFAGHSFEELKRNVLAGTLAPPPPENHTSEPQTAIAEPLQDALRQALQLAPEARFESLAPLLSALEAQLAEPPPQASPSPRKRPRRTPLVLALTAIVLLAALGLRSAIEPEPPTMRGVLATLALRAVPAPAERPPERAPSKVAPGLASPATPRLASPTTPGLAAPAAPHASQHRVAVAPPSTAGHPTTPTPASPPMHSGQTPPPTRAIQKEDIDEALADRQ